MKNVTVTLDEGTAHWARVEAAKKDLSVSSFLRQLLDAEREREESYEAAMERFFEDPPVNRGGKLPSREDLHDRAALR